MRDSSPRSSRLVGILGGMGPRATVDFYDKLVAHTPAGTDQEHVRVVLWADPTVPSRQAAILGDGADPSPWLRDGIARLVGAGAQILVVPCNTVHQFLPPLVPDGVEFLSIVDATMTAVARRPAGTVGLLATNAALASGLFQSALESIGRDFVLPGEDDQRRLTAIVEQVKDGTVDARSHAGLVEILDDLGARAATTTITACTELSALLGAYSERNGHDVLDPALELALTTIDRAFQPEPTGAAARPADAQTSRPRPPTASSAGDNDGVGQPDEGLG